MQKKLQLFVVATPIGNLGDITLRAIEVLKQADVILCEDTRHTSKLLAHFSIERKKLVSYHQHSDERKIADIGNLMLGGNTCAIVTDAGTPGISDPGAQLIAALVRRFGNDISIIPIPGASAAMAALSISGKAEKEFVFLGFPPIKKKRNAFFLAVGIKGRSYIIYESPYRILRTLADLEKVLGHDTTIMVCRELTKIYETTYRGTIPEILGCISAEKPRGEFVIII